MAQRISTSTMTLQPDDLIALKRAKTLLENPSMAARITNMLGAPIERGFALLPDRWHNRIVAVTRIALSKALDTALFTLKTRSHRPSVKRWHKIAAATTGGVGGFFGLPALAVELPVTTTIMLRAIADIARSEGEAIQSVSAKVACLEVFALGGPGRDDDATETGYFAVRSALAQSLSQAAEHLGSKK